MRVSGRLDVHHHVETDEGQQVGGFNWKFGPVEEQEGEVGGMKTLTMTDSQRATLEVGDAVDKKGNTVPIEGAPVVASSDDTIVTVTPHEDGTPNKYWLTAVGPLSSAAVVSITADTDTSTNVSNFVENIGIEIDGRNARRGSLARGWHRNPGPHSVRPGRSSEVNPPTSPGTETRRRIGLRGSPRPHRPDNLRRLL